METRIIEVPWAWSHPVVQDILLKYYREWLFNTPETAGRMVEQLLSITGVRPPAQVVDIGCGLGYHAVALAQRGYRVLAFDPGEKYLAIARENIATAGVEVEIHQMACDQLSETERFSLAWAGWYCPGQLSPAEVVQDFRRVYHALRAGGWFVSTVAGKPKIPPSEKVRNWGELSDCFALSEKWADDTSFHEHCWFVYPETNEVVKLIEVEKMYGVNELVPLLEQAGFIDVSTSDSLADTVAPAREGKHFSFRCRRPCA
jgi:SAM-dependent methyltransferase